MKEMRFYTVEGNENVAYETVEQARKNVNGIWENTPWGYTEKLNYEIIETVINENGKITKKVVEKGITEAGKKFQQEKIQEYENAIEELKVEIEKIKNRKYKTEENRQKKIKEVEKNIAMHEEWKREATMVING